MVVGHQKIILAFAVCNQISLFFFILTMPSVSKTYLLIYNVLQSLGWAVALSQVITGMKENRSLTGAYATAGGTVGKLICQCQNAF